MFILDSEGRTAEQFMEESFEFEYCAWCGTDADTHIAVAQTLGAYGGPYWFLICTEKEL